MSGPCVQAPEPEPGSRHAMWVLPAYPWIAKPTELMKAPAVVLDSRRIVTVSLLLLLSLSSELTIARSQ